MRRTRHVVETLESRTLLSTYGVPTAGSTGVTWNGGAIEQPATAPVDSSLRITAPAAASRTVVTNKTVKLSVLADDDVGAPPLTYTWACSAKPENAADATFSRNGRNAARTTKVRFYAAGDYIFTVYAQDAVGRSISSSVLVTVAQRLTSATVLPAAPVVLEPGTSMQFTAIARDQFNEPMAGQPSMRWTRRGVGTLSEAGLYTGPATTDGGTHATVRVTGGGVKASTSILINAEQPNDEEPSNDDPNDKQPTDDEPTNDEPNDEPNEDESNDDEEPNDEGADAFPNNVTVPALPAPTGTVVNVSTVNQLKSAVANLQSGVTIMIAPGTYDLTHTLNLPQNRINVAIRGATGNRDDVVIRGNGMIDGSISTGIWAGYVNGITIADLTIRDVTVHGITLNAGTESPLIHNVRLLDIGDQMIKANPDGALGGVDNGVLEYSVMEYSSGWAPDYYVAGLDIHTGDNWLICHNVFKDFRQQAGTTGTHPAVLIWNDSRNAQVLGNTFINNDWDISLGLYNASQNNASVPDQQGGRIEGNMIYRDAATDGDVAIMVTGPNTKVYHNTYFDDSGSYPYAIEYRFTFTTNADIRNNLLNRTIRARDGATGTAAHNLTTAQASWFLSPGTGDLHLKSTATQAIDQVAALSLLDYDDESRPALGTTADYGADEYGL